MVPEQTKQKDIEKAEEGTSKRERIARTGFPA